MFAFRLYPRKKLTFYEDLNYVEKDGEKTNAKEYEKSGRINFHV